MYNYVFYFVCEENSVLKGVKYWLVLTRTLVVGFDAPIDTPVSERTEIRILYSPKLLYIGVFCFDREPEKIVARKMRREESVRGCCSSWI